jgi:hypothetical protein
VQHLHRQPVSRQDDVRRERDQLGRVLAKEFSLAEEFSIVRPAKIEPHIAPFYPAPFLQHFAEGSDPVTSILIPGR